MSIKWKVQERENIRKRELLNLWLRRRTMCIKTETMELVPTVRSNSV